MIGIDFTIDVQKLLSQPRADLFYERLSEYKKKDSVDVRTIDDDGDEDYACALVKKYAHWTSVLLGLCQENVSGKRIVEVGPGYAGRFMMDYLTEQGADVSGIDVALYPDHTGPSQGRYKAVPWESISEGFSPGSVDIIHVSNMYPDPSPLQVRKDLTGRNLIKRWKAHRYLVGYESLVLQQTNNVLKEGGCLVLWHRICSDFSFNPEIVKKAGYDHRSINSWTSHSVGHTLDLYRKK